LFLAAAWLTRCALAHFPLRRPQSPARLIPTSCPRQSTWFAFSSPCFGSPQLRSMALMLENEGSSDELLQQRKQVP
jgi:hypothetical protein